MAEYAKCSVDFLFSAFSDYRTTKIDTSDIDDFTITPNNALRYSVLAKTTGTTLVLTNWSTVTFVLFKNKDTTNYVTVTWTDPGSTANSQRVAAGGFLVLPSISVAANIVMTANTANCACELVVAGSLS
jgi:hypothetical protein